MARPFANVLTRHPRAVVLLEQDAVELGAVERDYEWFDTVEGMNAFVTDAKAWADEDVQGYGKSNHLIVAIETMDLARGGAPKIIEVSAHGREADDLKALEDGVRKNPHILIEPPTVKGATKKATKAATKKVTPKVGARKATAAGQAVKVGAGAKVTPPKAEPAKAAAPARTAAGAKARATAAAKKAAAPTPTPPPAAPARRGAVRPTGAARKAAAATKDAAKAAPTGK